VPRKVPDKAAGVVVLNYELPAGTRPAEEKIIRRPASRWLTIGYHVVRGQLVAGEERADDDLWYGIIPSGSHRMDHFDYSLERYAGVLRDTAFACTLRVGDNFRFNLLAVQAAPFGRSQNVPPNGE